MPAPLLDKIRAALKRPAPTVPQLAAALADARQADADARHAVERQAEAVARGYLDPAPARAKARDILADLRADAEDAGLILAEVERQYAAAVAADADAVRRAAFDAAKAQCDAAAADLVKLYPQLALDLVALLGRVAMAQQAAAAVNADLPIGFGPLPDPEMVARGGADLPREVLSEREEVLWVHDQEQAPIRPAKAEWQKAIVDHGGGWGMAPNDTGAEGMSVPRVPYFRRHRLLRREVRDAVAAPALVPLARELNLPALGGGLPLWEAAERWRTLEPGEVAERVAAAEEAEAIASAPIVRPVRVEWEDLGEVDPRPMVRSDPADTTRHEPARTSRYGASPFNPASFSR